MRSKLFRAVAIGALAAVIQIATASQIDAPSAAIHALTGDLNLPADFVQRITDRAIIDAYQARYHRMEPGMNPAPRKLFAAHHSAQRFINVIRHRSSPAASQYRSRLPEGVVPLRGYLAPILERAEAMQPSLVLRDELNAKEIAAAECVARRLAHDGLLSTLAQVIEIFGPDQFAADEAAGLRTLQAVGFPTDLLAGFSVTNGATGNTPPGVIPFTARWLAGGAIIEPLKPEWDKLSFRFVKTHPSFRVATESGEHELGTLRVQVGGGYDDGIVPGGSIDVICQLVGAFPAANFLISTPDAYFQPFRELASQTWRLRRTNQVTLISEPLAVGAWAQDNGKAGYFAADASPGLSPGPGRQQPATLAPRYACIGEGQSSFQKGESFLMDGLQAAGHAVAQSPLLFQGGNLLAARDPKSGERLLLIGEAELYRNLALGLARSQALEAFRVEFGVDRCVVIPSVSYHLDFDVSLRAHGGGLIAFVNDTMSAARAAVGLGLDALAKAGTLEASTAQATRADLASGRDLELVRRLRTVIPRHSPGTAGYPASLSRAFVSGQLDSAAGNLQCFLLALDLMESSVEEGRNTPTGIDPEHAAYLQALRRLNAARQAQAEVFRNQGWKVVAIPSMTDLYRSINYLNGIQHHQGYVMPAFGGFYAPLDAGAVAAFRQVLGAEFTITSILSAESQRHHGGVHCTTAAYPKF